MTHFDNHYLNKSTHLPGMKIYGMDFTSAPSHKKPITWARCRLEGEDLYLDAFKTLGSFPEFERALAEPGPWVGGLDFPFGQPRRLVENLGWPTSWAGYVGLLSRMSKNDFDLLLKAYRDQRPAGDKQHLRQTDALAGSKSPMMMYGVPVGKMFFEGAPRLLRSGASILPCHPQEETRVVVEAYPGLVARRWVEKNSYKNDARRKQTLERQHAREGILRGLGSAEASAYYGFRIHCDDWTEEFIRDGSGDKLDALLCAVQAAWAYTQREQGFGIPTDCDPLEGWIIDPGLVDFGIG